LADWQDGKMARWQDGKMARWQDGKMANWSEWSHSRPFVTSASASFHQGTLVSSELLDY
jgi:hypothetical protein